MSKDLQKKSNVSLAVVIVTFNRLEKLKHTLSCYDNQVEAFDHLIVVDNKSTDGTNDFLCSWEKEPSRYAKCVISMEHNVGGSGGFFAGQSAAIDLKADWVFLADDDAYPDKDMIASFYEYINHSDISDISAICTSVLHPDGSYSCDHRRVVKTGGGLLFRLDDSTPGDYAKASFDIDALSYVGSFIKVDALVKSGTVNKDYFIYVDDTEHSLRLRKTGRIVTIPQARIVHDSGVAESKQRTEVLCDWRDYYYNRNYLNMLLRHKHWLTLVYYTLSQLNQSIRSKNPERRRMLRTAAIDGVTNKLGIHAVYKPGWKLLKESK